MAKKIAAIFIALAVLGAFLLVSNPYCDAKGGGGRSAGRSFSAPKPAPKAAAPKANTSGYKKSNTPSSSPSKGNTNGYKKDSAPAKGSTSTTNGGGKVTSGGGNTSGYKSKQTQTKEEANKKLARGEYGNSSSHWYGGTNNHYYGSNYDSGFGHFASGMLFGSMLSSPWHVYAGAPGYVGSYGIAPEGVAAGGFYSPFSGIIGVIVWLIEWSIAIALLIAIAVCVQRWYSRRKNR